VTILKGIGHWTQQEAAVDTNTALLNFLKTL
jgi:pimeloyl-ACP methyl ester carboxylesterase